MPMKSMPVDWNPPPPSSRRMHENFKCFSHVSRKINEVALFTSRRCVLLTVVPCGSSQTKGFPTKVLITPPMLSASSIFNASALPLISQTSHPLPLPREIFDLAANLNALQAIICGVGCVDRQGTVTEIKSLNILPSHNVRNTRRQWSPSSLAIFETISQNLCTSSARDHCLTAVWYPQGLQTCAAHTKYPIRSRNGLIITSCPLGWNNFIYTEHSFESWKTRSSSFI